MDLELLAVNGAMNKMLDDFLDVTVAGNHTGLLGTAHVGLFQAPTPAFNINRVLADITEATFDGYARKPVVWGNQSVDPAGRQSVHGGGLLFSPTGAVTPNTLTGIFLADALVAGILLALAYFAEGVAFDGIEDDLTIVPVFAVPLVGNWGKFAAVQ